MLISKVSAHYNAIMMSQIKMGHDLGSSAECIQPKTNLVWYSHSVSLFSFSHPAVSSKTKRHEGMGADCKPCYNSILKGKISDLSWCLIYKWLCGCMWLDTGRSRKVELTCSLYLKSSSQQTKHLYNICTASAQRLRRWPNIKQMLYKCFVLTGFSNLSFILLQGWFKWATLFDDVYKGDAEDGSPSAHHRQGSTGVAWYPRDRHHTRQDKRVHEHIQHAS